MMEYFLAILLLVLILAVPLTALVVALVQWWKVRGLSRRITELEAVLRGHLERAGQGGAVPASGASPQGPRLQAAEGGAVPLGEIVPPETRRRSEPIQWEAFIGGKALGWVAVALFMLAAAFFLKYAYDNNWIGPQGQIAIAAAAGAALMIAGRYYHHHAWRVFSQMLTAAGVVVLYLATYAGFGFYHLMPQQIAAGLLAVIVIESALLALRYDSLAVALTALLGGLLTPVLMHSDYDRYVQLFIYLTLLDLGVVMLILVRPWPALGTVGLAGTQILFWQWYHAYYHPEKLAWAIGFQAAVFGLFLAQTMLFHLVRSRRATWEDVARVILNAGFWFLAVYVLLKPDYAAWLGSAAIGLAAVYALLARLLLWSRPADARPLLATIAVSAGFIALAFPLEAEASWIALGWAAEAAVLWWFGQRIGAPTLRLIAAALAAAALGRVLAVDLPPATREWFVPIFNQFALPAVSVAACLLVAVVSTRRMVAARHRLERAATALAAGLVLLYLWFILSLECLSYFGTVARMPETNADDWRWLGQMAVSILSALYATTLIAIGFWRRNTGLRALALLIYGLTVVKVVTVDMRESSYLYRVLAFLAVAMLIGGASWAYQRIRIDQAPRGSSAGDGEDED
jgi:uncharacterized membrane protein